MGGWSAKSYPNILLHTLNYTSPTNFIQIGPKLPKFYIWGGFRVAGVGGWGGLGVPILILEENLAHHVIRRHHEKFQLASSKRLEIIPCLK